MDKRTAAEPACHIAQHVDMAESINASVDHCLNLTAISQLGSQRYTGLGIWAKDVPKPSSVHIEERQSIAGCTERLGNRAPEIARRTCDNRNPVCRIE
jgi:hypothetical protein